MDASFPHADLLFAAIIQGPKAEGQVKPRSRPSQRKLMYWHFILL